MKFFYIILIVFFFLLAVIFGNRKMRYFYISSIIVFFLGCIIFGTRKSFNELEIFWIMFGLLFYNIFFSLSSRLKVILLLIILFSKTLKASFILVTMLPLIICVGRYSMLRHTTEYIFHKCLRLQLDYSLLPKHPTIFISNYPANHIEYIANTLLSKKMCLMIWGRVNTSKLVKLLYGKDSVIIVDKGSFDKTQKTIMSKMKEGYSIFVYAENSYSDRKDKIYTNVPLRTGIFSIAKNIGATITPVVFDHIEHSFGFVKNNDYKIFVDKTRIVTDIDEEILQVSNLFTRKLRRFKIK